MGVRYELERGRVALLVIDMTNDFLEDGAAGEVPVGRAIVAQTARLIEASRRAGAPVVYTTHVLRRDGSDAGRMADMWPNLIDREGRPKALVEGTEGIEIYPELAPRDGDVVVAKHRSSAFFERELDSILRGMGTRSVIVAGVATNGCCLTTAFDASFRGYEVVFASDATATSGLPDEGFGAYSAEECQRSTLALVAFAVGEVASTDEIVARLGASSAAAAVPRA